jgi:zinc/manganese transport system ATP-binding protein
VILGLTQLAAGTVEVLGQAPRRGNPGIGYVPQHQSFDQDLPLRGRDLVQMGIDGHRWGVGRPSAADRRRVSEVIEAVEATPYADAAIGRLSGGEQQRLRIAQAIVGDPRLLLCDEPLASLDLHHQQEITDLIGGWQQRTGRTVLFVTHDVNPILQLVDRVLFVVNGRWAAGTPDEVLTSERMSELYGSHVDVLRVHGRILVVSESTGSGFELEEPHHLPEIHPGGPPAAPRQGP